MDEERFRKTCIKEKGKKGGIRQPFYGTWVEDFMLRQDVEGLAGKAFEWQTNCIKVKDTFEDGRGRNYANSQTSNQNRQDALNSRVSAVQESETCFVHVLYD